MGSVWCKPSEMRQDCSPKLNIQSLMSRISSQMCPNKCRYPQTGGHPRKKPRPRSAVLSQGKRPEISSPLVQPIPPPRKKRKNTQDMSRSEEILCPQESVNPALRPSTSLPIIYDPNTIILRNCIDIKPMESIVEENSTTNKIDVNEAEMDSLPPSEVYFLKKEQIPVVFTEAKSVADITENDEYLNHKKPMNDTFTAINETDSIPEKVNEQIIKNDTVKVTNKVQKSSEKENGDNKSNFVKDKTDSTSIKKWQDAMKKKWLQSILIDAEPKDVSNQVTVNGSLQINTSLNLEKKLSVSAAKSDENINEDISSNLSSNIKNNSSSDSKNQDDDCKTNRTLKNILENTQEQIPKLLVTPKTLSDTLERLQNVDLTNQDNLINNRNLIYSSENLNNMNNSSQMSKANRDLKQDNLKDTLKLDAALEEKLYSNRNSRHSSITDSLQEFETAIYDMLQQSAKENVSDEDNSLLIIDVKDKSNDCVANPPRAEKTPTY